MLKILIIDDEKAIRDSFRNFLEDCDYNVLEAANGLEGLEVFKRESPDLVLVDLNMPEVDGIGVLRRVTQWAPDTAIIVVSGTGLVGDVLQALRLGAWDYLYKPIENLSVLLHAVEKALERSRLLKENKAHREHLELEVKRRTEELSHTTQALRESELQFRSLVEQAPFTIEIFSMDGVLIAANKAWEKLWGQKREVVVNKFNVFEDKQIIELGMLPMMKRIFNGESPVLPEVEFSPPGRPRHKRYLHSHYYPIRNSRGEVRNIVVMHEDTTERRKSEEERRKLEEQLRQFQKMEAIGSLAGGIAHDFNNLLTVINGHSEMALIKMEKGLPLLKDINAILQAGKRAANLTRQLLAFSRKQIFKPQVVGINQVISGLEKILQRLIGEDIYMTLQFEADIPRVKADPGQIEQVLMNLIVNARDALNVQSKRRKKKKISIETGMAYLDESYVVRHAESKTGVHVFFSVTDNGIGINEETKLKIFEPFYTTKGMEKGTGLGLSTVYGIVTQNGGSIEMDSEPGKGSTFKIYWPATTEPETVETAEKKSSKVLTGKETILLVEDEEAVRKFTLESLESLGYKVFEAGNGGEAQQLLTESNLEIDLLITDLIMPEMSGWELAEKFKEMYPGIAILYTSGYTDEHIIRDGVLEESIHFIHKPYSLQTLAEKIREILASVDK
ncbi:MAG: response regulator [bacterium]|nr:response regulator [bacterium]